MLFTETTLMGAYIIDQEPSQDERGYFSRTWCKREFKERGIDFFPVQCNLSYNTKKGTLRGMHYQRAPYAEAKLVSCVKGSIYDVIIDLRPGSLTFKHWTSIILSEENKRQLYVPEGFAHGFQTLKSETTVFYQMSEYYYSDYASGIVYNDPSFGIKWPDSEQLIISKKDKMFEGFEL